MALVPGNKKSPEEEKAAQDDVLMREIDDAVREDQDREFGEKYGKPLIAAVVLGLAGFGGYLYWDGQREAAMESDSEALVAVLDQAEAGNFDSANSSAQALAGESEGAAQAAALMTQAGIAMDQDRVADAVALFAQVASDENAPPVLRDLALIREMSASFDTRDPGEVVEKLSPLAVPGNPWFGSAGELVAMAYAEQGNSEQAGTLFGEIARNEDVPETLRARARQMAGLMGVDAIEDADEFMAEQELQGSSAPSQ